MIPQATPVGQKGGPQTLKNTGRLGARMLAVPFPPAGCEGIVVAIHDPGFTYRSTVLIGSPPTLVFGGLNAD